MTSGYDDRDDERDWPEDHAPAHLDSEQPPALEPEDDAARLPIRPHKHRPAPRRRSSYRPPSELDGE